MTASSKTLLFFLGLTVGLLAGAGFFIFKMDTLLKEINLFQSKKDTVIIHHEVRERNTAAEQKTPAKNFPKDTSKKNISFAELLAKKYAGEIPVKKLMAEADSLFLDTVPSSAFPLFEEEDIIVRKDELLGVKTVEVLNYDTAGAAPSSADTAMEQISGIRSSNKILTSFKTEFWKSPVNYKGYKMTKNKIVLFGISPEEEVQLYMMEETIYMKVNKNFFRLSFTDEFKQFEKVAPPHFLKAEK